MASSPHGFVAGHEVVFEDALVGEEQGAFPSCWQTIAGRAEVVEVPLEDGMQSILLFDHSAIAPLMASEKYLPKAFTLELNVYLEPESCIGIWFWDANKDSQHTRDSLDYVEVRPTGMSAPSRKLSQAIAGVKADATGDWHYVSLAFTPDSYEVYLDRQRLLTAPRATRRSTAFAIGSQKSAVLICHVRLAESGKCPQGHPRRPSAGN